MSRVASRRRCWRIPVVVWLVTGVWASLLLGASLVWKMSYGYDEPLHIDLAYVYSRAPFAFYGPGELLPTRAVETLETEVPGYQIDHNWPDATEDPVGPVRDRADRPTLDEAGGEAPGAVDRRNQMIQHPPLYYWLEALVLRLPGVSGLAWDLQVWLMRLFGVVLALPVPILCWATARRLLEVHPARGSAPPEAWAVLAALVPLSVPGLVRNLSSVSNDVLLVVATSVFLYGITRVLTGDLTTRTSLVVSASLAIALLSKGFGLVLPPVALIAYWWAVSRGRPGAGQAVRLLARPAVAVAVGCVVGGSWWLRNLLLYRTVQVNGLGPSATTALYGPPDGGGSLSRFIPAFAGGVLGRIWGGVGLPDDPVPGPLVVYGWLALAAAGLLVALVLPSGPGMRFRVWLLTLPALLALVVVAVGSLADFRTWSAYVHGAQGRYLYLAVVPFSAAVAVGWRRLFRCLGARALARSLALVGLAALVTNAVVWAMIVSTWYTTGPTLSLTTMRVGAVAVLAWAPVPPGVVVALAAVVPFVVGVASVVALARPTSSRAGPPATMEA